MKDSLPTPPKKQNPLRIVVIVVAVILFGYVYNAVRNPRPAPVPAAAVAPTAALTLTPAPTLAPTVAAPTAAPAPTAVPAATAPTTASTQAAHEAYRLALLPEVKALGEGLGGLGTLLQSAQPSNQDWVIKAAAAVVMVENAHAAIQKIVPPADLAPLHVRLVSATGSCDTAVRTLSKSIDQQDQAQLLAAAQSMQQCTANITALAPDMKQALNP